MRCRRRDRAFMCTLILLSACGEELTVIVDGEGRVTSSPPGIDCGLTCVAKLDSGSQVTLTVTPAPGSVFVTWMGDCQVSEPSCSMAVDGPKTVIAKIVKLHRLSVEVSGEGDAQVVSEPPGIDCPKQCSADFPTETEVTLTAVSGKGVRVGGFEGACEGDSCVVRVMGPAKVRVKTEAIPGTLLWTERIDETGRGAFAVDAAGQPIWAKQTRLETYSREGKRIRRATVEKVGLTSVTSIAPFEENTVVGGPGAEGSIVAAIKSGGEAVWSAKIPGAVHVVRAWNKGTVAAVAIEGKVTIGAMTLGQRKKPNGLIVWLDTDGKVSDAVTLPIELKEPPALAVDQRGAAVLLVRSGKQHVLHKVSGSEGQRFEVVLGELERAAVDVGGSGRIWIAGTALSVAEELAAVGIARPAGARCDDAGFGFFLALDSGGAPVKGKSWGRGVAGFALGPDGMTVALEFVGDVATATGTFTSAGYAARIQDCGQECEESVLEEASCVTEPDVLFGVLGTNLEHTWARHLSAEGDIAIVGVSASGGFHTAAVSVGERMRVIGGERETSLPSGVSLLRFR